MTVYAPVASVFALFANALVDVVSCTLMLITPPIVTASVTVPEIVPPGASWKSIPL